MTPQDEPAATKRARVTWTEDELTRLCAAISDVVELDRSIRPITAIQRAQQMELPVHRRRGAKSPALFGKKAAARFKAAFEAGLLRRPKGPTPPAPEPLPEPAQALPEPARPDLSTVPTQELLAALLLRLGGELMARLDRIEAAMLSRVSPAAPPRPQPVPVPKPAPKPRDTVVATVGLLRDQHEHVRQKVRHLPITLVWCDKEAARPSFPASTDYVLVQRHSPHYWYDEAKARLPADRVMFVDGGISACTQRLMDIHSRVVAEAARNNNNNT